METAVRELGGIDILVDDAAGQASQYPIPDIGRAQFDDTFKTNMYAMFWLTKAAMPHRKEDATIINTASVNADNPGEKIVPRAHRAMRPARCSPPATRQLVMAKAARMPQQFQPPSGGCHSSTLLPSGSISQPNLP